MADNAELVSMSYLARGETIPAGARWSCPAQPFKGSQETKEWPVAHAGSPVKAAFCGAGQALVILSLPMLVTLPAVLTLELLLSLFGRPGSLEALVRAPLWVVLQIFGLNSHCTVQTHLFEDRVSKQSTLKIGDDCGLGAMAVVLVDSRMGDGSYLNALSLLMKGEALPPRSEWAGIPIRKVTRPRAGR